MGTTIIILSLLAFINIIITIFTIVVGIKKFNLLGKLKILIVIPILSISQNLFVELIPFTEKYIPVRDAANTVNKLINKTSVEIYIFLEFTIIVFFLFKLIENKKEKQQTILLYSISIISILYPFFFSTA